VGGELVFIVKFIAHHESSKGMGLFEDESSLSKCRNCIQSRISNLILA